MYVDVQQTKRMQGMRGSWFSGIRIVEQMSECIHLLPGGVIQEENIMKLLSESGGSGTCNICHAAILMFLNDSWEKWGRLVCSWQRKFDFFSEQVWLYSAKVFTARCLQMNCMYCYFLIFIFFLEYCTKREDNFRQTTSQHSWEWLLIK